MMRGIFSGRGLVVMAALVALAQIGFLYAMIAGRAAILRDGEIVVLSVQPVDPRDLLRGDYVVLNYNISALDAALVEDAPAEMPAGSVVHVRLQPDADGIWQPVGARFGGVPEAGAGEGVVIRGTTRNRQWAERGSLSVAYGIERFYVPEGQGRPIEADMGRRAFTMHVAVAGDGRAQIRSFHDGETMLFREPLY